MFTSGCNSGGWWSPVLLTFRWPRYSHPRLCQPPDRMWTSSSICSMWERMCFQCGRQNLVECGESLSLGDLRCECWHTALSLQAFRTLLSNWVQGLQGDLHVAGVPLVTSACHLLSPACLSCPSASMDWDFPSRTFASLLLLVGSLSLVFSSYFHWHWSPLPGFFKSLSGSPV